MKTFEFNLNHYISFEGSNSLRNQASDNPLVFEKIKTIKKEIKSSSTFLCAQFLYDKSNLTRADLDNILLYNLHINQLDSFDFISLEKISMDREDFEYRYTFKNSCVVPKRNTILTFNYLPFDDVFTKKGFDKTKNLYRTIRRTLMDQNLLTKVKYDPNKKYGLKMTYLGNAKITETGFLKPIIDAFVSSLHKFSYSSTEGIEDLYLDFESNKNDYFIDKQTKGPLLIKRGKYNSFNPMDEMLSLIQLNHLKTKNDDEEIVFDLFEY